MSLSSTRSGGIRRKANGVQVTEAQVYQYALRVAYLAHLLRPKPIEPPPPEDDPASAPSSSSHPDPTSSPASHRGHRDQLRDAFKMPDFTSMFMGGGGSSSRSEAKSSKFPKDALKVLDEKLRAVFMGKDPNYLDQRIRRTVATFWSNTSDVNYLRGVRENRKIEELILMMVSVATKELQKEVRQLQEKKIEPDFDWKYELNVQVGQIVRILRDTLKSVSSTSPELLNKLEGYSSKLAATPTPALPPPPTPAAKPTPPPLNSSVSGMSQQRISRPPSVWNPIGPTSEMVMVQTVGTLFGKSAIELEGDVNAIKATCTEKAVMTDLKTCLKNINAGLSFPARREDFDSDDAWNTYRQAEVTTLSQLVMVLVQVNPDLAKESNPSSSSDPSSSENSSDKPPKLRDRDRPESWVSISDKPDSIYNQFTKGKAVGGGEKGEASRNPSVRSVGSILDGLSGDDGEAAAGNGFVYIPPNERTYFKRLLEKAIDFDLDAMADLPEDQEVTLTILSDSHVELLNECALRWRLPHSYRSTVFLDVIRHRYEKDEVPLECVPEALIRTMSDVKRSPVENWMTQDSRFLFRILSSLWDHFLRALHASFDDISRVKLADVAPYIAVLEDLRETNLIGHDPLDQQKLDDIADHIRQEAFGMYSAKTTEVFGAEEDEGNEVEPLLKIIDWTEKQAKLFRKRFPQPILGAVHVVAIVLGQQVPLLLQDLEEAYDRIVLAALGTATQQPTVDIDEVFALYRRSTEIVSMHEEYCPGEASFDIGAYFEPFVRRWLKTTDGLTSKWVAEAIRVDNFEPDGISNNSSSIVDLFGSFSSALDFLYSLNWPDRYQEARFLTSMSKTLSRVMDQYCSTIEEMFLSEMFPRDPVDPSLPKENPWFVKAKLTLQGEKKIEPFNFIPASCVKLNNVETARNELDRMYQKMGVDDVMQIIEESAPQVPAKTNPRYLFTVKIILAENLVASDRNPSSKLDTFVTLSDQQGYRLAKTRTVYESLDPRWDQTFDISVEKDLWLMATVRDRSLVGKHDDIGRAYVRLDPRRYADFLTHEVWYDLEEKTGRLLLRISMEGEKDEIGFYFGRAFRSLKRAETDMIRIFVDKMSPFIRQSLTRSVIKSLIKSTVAPIDYNETINKLTDRFRSAITTTTGSLSSSTDGSLIPLPKDELPPPPPPSKYPNAHARTNKVLTDVDIEGAINPLFDYFDVNQATLSSTLSLTSLQAVMGKTWKEILSVLEGLLIPPLSASPTDMVPLTDQEVDIVMKWREFLRDYFHAQGDEKGLSKETLHNQKYNELMSIRLHYDWSTDALMEQCVRDIQASLRRAGTMKRAKSVYQSRNLGTIKDRKKEKKKATEQGNAGNADIILRILRMRPGSAVQEFIAQQLDFKLMIAKQAATSNPPSASSVPPSSSSSSSQLGRGGRKRDSRVPGGGGLSIPPVPSLPAARNGSGEGGQKGYQLRD